jgi:uncharacterized protein Smg (DUF494 family)
MANEKLNDYIKKCIELGKQREEITNNLLGVGWSKEDIDASFSAVKEEASVPEVPTKEVAFKEPIDDFSNSLNNEINSIQEESNNLNENLKQEKSSINMRRKEVFKEERIIDDSEENNSKKIITPIVVIVVVLLIFSIAFAFIQKIGPFSSPEVEPEIVQENDEILEDWGYNDEDQKDTPKNKVYFAGQKINNSVALKTQIDDFIECNTSKARINPKYRKIDE